jgi:hypothetical protein
MLFGALAVVTLQMTAPCPYDDYQVPLMGLAAVVSVAAFFSFSTNHPVFDSRKSVFLVAGLSYAVSFGSPLLQEWMCD